MNDLLYWDVDEVIETLLPTAEKEIEAEIMGLAPDAYQADGVSMGKIWYMLKLETRSKLTAYLEAERAK